MDHDKAKNGEMSGGINVTLSHSQFHFNLLRYTDNNYVIFNKNEEVPYKKWFDQY